MREHLLRESLRDVTDRLAEQLGLAGEVVLQRTRAHAGALGDAPSRRVRIALLDQTLDRRIE
jgi:hypothetical protein